MSPLLASIITYYKYPNCIKHTGISLYMSKMNYILTDTTTYSDVILAQDRSKAELLLISNILSLSVIYFDKNHGSGIGNINVLLGLVLTGNIAMYVSWLSVTELNHLISWLVGNI